LPCEGDEPTGEGEFGGRMCTWRYDLLPAETNAGEDFSAFWLQMEVFSGGECIRAVELELQVPKGVRVVSGAPAKGGRFTRSSVPTTTELIVDAEGTAFVPGTVVQDSAAPAGRVEVAVGARRYRYSWRGNSRDTVMIPLGVQLAHSAVPEPTRGQYSLRGQLEWSWCSLSTISTSHKGRGEYELTQRFRL
jgi:hypothetical protein